MPAVLEDMLWGFMGFEGKYIRADRARSSKGGISFVLNGKLDHAIHELVMRMLPIWYVVDSMHSNLVRACKCNHPCGVVRLSTSLLQYILQCCTVGYLPGSDGDKCKSIAQLVLQACYSVHSTVMCCTLCSLS